MCSNIPTSTADFHYLRSKATNSQIQENEWYDCDINKIHGHILIDQRCLPSSSLPVFSSSQTPIKISYNHGIKNNSLNINGRFIKINNIFSPPEQDTLISGNNIIKMKLISDVLFFMLGEIPSNKKGYGVLAMVEKPGRVAEEAVGRGEKTVREASKRGSKQMID